MTALPPATDFTGAGVTEGGFKTAITDMRAAIAGVLGTDGTAATARSTLGFTSPILDKAAPGAIGATTPAAGTFSTLTGTGSTNFGSSSGDTLTSPSTMNLTGPVRVGGYITSMEGRLQVRNDADSEGTSFMAIRGGAFYTSLFSIVGANGWNNAGQAQLIGKHSSTGRSISAGGTLNASGADYAEYERKAASCVAELLKGQIVGFDAEGLVTDRWADSISFGTKSTNPSYVGGDMMGFTEMDPQHPGDRPELKPRPPEPALVLPAQPARQPRETEEEFEARFEQWEDRCAELDALHTELLSEREAAWTAYVEATTEAQRVYDQEKLPAYEQAIAEFEERRNVARAPFDRVAYSGKVPVNVTGAQPGDYIVPVEADGGIGGIAVPKASITFEQYRIAVGQVRRILNDGRAEISVKVS